MNAVLLFVLTLGLSVSVQAMKDKNQSKKMSSDKEEALDIEYKIFGTAYLRASHKALPRRVALAKYDEFLHKQNLKIISEPGDVTDLFKSRPDPAQMKKYDAYIIRPHLITSLMGEYVPILGLDIQSRCYQEIQVITLRNSGFTSLGLLSGKNVGLQESKVRINFLLNSKTKFKEVLLASPKELLEALKKGSISAIIDVAQKYPDRMHSLTLGNYRSGKADAGLEYQVVYTTDYKIPCFVLAAKVEKAEVLEKRLLALESTNRPEVAKSIFNAIGGFYSIYPIRKDWERIWEIIHNDNAYERYKTGNIKEMTFKRYK